VSTIRITREGTLERVAFLAPSPMAVIETGEGNLASREHVHASPASSAQAIVVGIAIADPDTVVVSLSNTPAGVLVVNDVHDVGWIAEVDGQPAGV
jgi:hypothetical protein